MGRACVVADCQSRGSTVNGCDLGSLKISHHEFPSDEAVRREWINAIRQRVRGGPKRQAVWMPSDMTTVCGLHFLDTDYVDQLIGGSVNPRRRRLKPTAVPTVFDERIPLPPQETNDLHVLMEQTNRKTTDDDGVENVPKKRVRWSGLVPRYRRRRDEQTEPSNDGEVSKDIVTDNIDGSVTSLDPTEKADGVPIEEVMAVAESPVVVQIEDSGKAGESLEEENGRLHQEMRDLQRKMSMAQLNLKFMEKLLKVKEVKKSRAMGRSYYYEKMCSKLRVELTALKTHEEELSSSNLPLMRDIETQAARGDVQAMFLMQQIRHFGKGNRARPQWEDAVLDKCASWLNKSHFSYRFVKRLGLVLLPSRSTLSRFADWKATTVTKDEPNQSIAEDPAPADGAEQLERQQGELLSVEMIDASDASDSLDVLNRLADAAEVTIITLDPNTGVLEWRVDASTTQEIIEMTTSSEPSAST